MAKKGIKEIVALIVKGQFQVQSAQGLEMQELLELSDKRTRWEQASEKGSGPSTRVIENYSMKLFACPRGCIYMNLVKCNMGEKIWRKGLFYFSAF